MASSAYKPFGAVTTKSSGHVDFSANSGFKYTPTNKSQSSSEGVKDILQSAVGDFTERPLQIMIREIAKNLLIFTPIGWIALACILGYKYKGKFGLLFSQFSEAFSEVINSLCPTRK